MNKTNHKPHLVVILLYEASKSQSELLIRSNTPVHAEYCPWCVIFVNLFSLTRRWL